MKLTKDILILLAINWGIFIILGLLSNLESATFFWEIWWASGNILAIIDSIIAIIFVNKEEDYCRKYDMSKKSVYTRVILLWLAVNGVMLFVGPIIGIYISSDPGVAIGALAAMSIGGIPLITLMIFGLAKSLGKKINKDD